MASGSSKKFKRMTLIEEAELERLREKQIRDYNPTLKTLADIQANIDKLIDHPVLNPEGKMQLLSYLQTRFQKIYKRAKNEILPTPLIPSESTVEADMGNANSFDIPSIPEETKNEHVQKDQVIHEKPINMDSEIQSNSISGWPSVTEARIPQVSERKYNALIQYLSTNQNHLDISNKSRELLIDGTPLKGASVSDLMHSLFTRSKSFNMHGHSEFLDALRNIELPLSFITNPNVNQILMPSDSASTSMINLDDRKSFNSSVANPKKFLVYPGRHHRYSTTNSPPGKKPKLLKLYQT